MGKNVTLCGIVCLAICLLGAPCLAQSNGMLGPELRQWIENPALGLAALREGHLADLPKASASPVMAVPTTAPGVVSDKAVEVTFVDPGMEAAVRDMFNRPTGPLYDEEVAAIQRFDGNGHGIQSVADLQYMPALIVLYLQNNNIASLAGFPPLDHLSELFLDHNQLTSFAGLPSLPQLSRIYARHNRLGSLAGFPSFPWLSRLYLDNNEIVSLTGMGALPQLVGLGLSHNRLASLAGLPDNPAIPELNLSHNALQSLSGMPKYDSVSLLDVSFNQLTTADGLYHATYISQLNAGNNQLESLGVIGQLSGLQMLYVGANRLTSLTDTSFSPYMSELDVSRNQLSSLAGVENFSNLHQLNAAGNRLKSFGELAGLVELTYLSLAGNGLNSLADIPRLPGVESLDVSCNQLAALADLGDTPRLSNLEARFNQLQTLDLGFRPGLGYLGVSSNGLTTLNTLTGSSTPSLYMIDVSFNQLTSLQGAENLPTLTAIAARGNQITSLAALSKNPQLNWLDVSSNQLASFDDLPSDPPIAWLNASRNGIASLSGLAAAANLYLNRLDVSHNLLTSVAEIATADHLYKLDISDNQVSDVTPLRGRNWWEMGIANNPTGDLQSLLFPRGGDLRIVSVGPGQLPSLAPFGAGYGNYESIHASGPEYADLSLIGPARPTDLRVSEAGISSLAGLAASFRLYGGSVSNLALPNNALSDLSPLADIFMAGLDVSGNNISDLAPVTSGYLTNFNPYEVSLGIQYLNLRSNPIASLEPALGRELVHMNFPPIGANIFWEYQWERFGMSPEQAHNCLTWGPVVNVTDTPVAAAPEVAQLRAEGVTVRTDGTCSYCQGTCVPQVTVPDVAGMTQEAAAAALGAAGLVTGTTTQQCSDTIPAGSVISQNPVAGTAVDAGSSVALLVSLGPCTVPVAVPDVVGQTASDAVAAIQTAGLLVGALTQQYSGTVPPGSVISQNPAAGTSVPPNTAVALTVSLGANPAEGEIEGEPQTPLSEQAQALFDGFAAADTNGDGNLSLAEAQAAQPGLTAEEFALLDRNGDGTLSKDELNAYLNGPCGCGGCHGGGTGWGERLGELFVLLLTLLGVGLIGDYVRP